MQYKSNNRNNVRPSKTICEKCESHNFCIAEDGKEEYKCWKMVWLPKHQGELKNGII